MPVDTSIYNLLGHGVKSIQDYAAEDQQRQLGAAQLQAAQTANMLGQQKADEYSQTVAERNALRQYLGGDVDLSTPQGVAGLYKAAPTQADSILKSYADRQKDQAQAGKFKADAGKTDFETALAKQHAIANLAGAATDQVSWDRARMVAAQLGADVSQVPAQFDPNVAKQIAGMALTQMQRLEDAHKQAQDAHQAGMLQVAQGNLAVNRGQLGVAQGNLGLRSQELGLRQQEVMQPQYMQTDQGLVALPKKLAPGQAPTAVMVAGADGQALGKPLKDIPATVNTAIISNAQNLSKAQQALALLEGKKVGAMTGDTEATGLKGMLPGAILNRMDPNGVDTRAAIADLGSMVLHDRSGAAVTASEYPRLQPFIPTATDDKVTAAKKLRRFIQVYEQETKALGDTYSKDQGYKPSPVVASGPKPADRSVVRTGTHNGRKVVQYSDGSVDYAD
jgi:hypothetical protein